jgi:hypothetical protein
MRTKMEEKGENFFAENEDQQRTTKQEEKTSCKDSARGK